ncbi:MAG: acyl-CoA/acyl-ACP dehydrogenase [Robiginitomaculum sp.]|nr:acyl-CoA/acyl-ACP dehydrogenase [Robiginitomaculum sp.]
MDIEFSEQQRLIQNSARSFFAANFNGQMIRDIRSNPKAGLDTNWQDMADLGFMGINVPEKFDGFDGSFVDLLVLLEEMGRVTLPGPFFSTVVYAAEVLKAANNQNINKTILPAISSGAAKLAVIIGDEGSELDAAALSLNAAPAYNGYSLNGVSQFVAYGNDAEHYLCAARMGRFENPTHDIGLFCIPAITPGIKRETLNTMNGPCAAKITFENVQLSNSELVGEGEDLWPVLEQAMFRTAVAKCAQMVGACGRIIEIAVEHAKERRQFGKPIGSFQAIQHHCADMLTDLDSARWMMYKTGWKIDEGIATRQHMAMTKAWCNQACRRILRTGHQVMGGIGYCEEHDMPLFFRYLRMAEAALGTSDDHLAVIATDLLSGLDEEKE